MAGWAPDLSAALQRGYLAFFSCANDYSDLRGEVAMHELLGSRRVLPPRKNPFHAMSIVTEPIPDGATVRSGEWCRANFFIYAVRGLERRQDLGDGASSPPGDTDGSKSLQAHARELARFLKQTQQPSPVP
mmetsp:Transcript_13282/g.31192  ORF Transcript_13282/g.31192 Transcript_13282/m.31192 type:complete len:131 (-) Transcript_13282:241-633(-)